MTDTVDIRDLFALPESEWLDFKATRYDLSDKGQKRSFAKDLACLANTPRQGNAYLVLGVKKRPDNSFTLVGIAPPVDDADLQSVAASLLEPSPRFLYQGVTVDGFDLGIITIPPAQALPTAPRKTQDGGFVEGRLYFRRGSQNADASMQERSRIWAWFLGVGEAQAVSSVRLGGQLGREQAVTPVLRVPSLPAVSPAAGLDPEPLLVGPVEASGLAPVVEEAQRLAATSPADAARIYGGIAEVLRDRFPGHAHRFERLRATTLRDAGDPAASHDLLMSMAVRDLFERSEPRPNPGVTQGLRDLHEVVDEVRQARGAAVIAFAQWHEHPQALGDLAAQFDNLGPTDAYAPFIAALLAEAALADRDSRPVLEREENLRQAGARGDSKTELRVQLALADARGVWQKLAEMADSRRLPAEAAGYVCLRAARWYAWDGETALAERFYRRATEVGAAASLDLDVEQALWSLTTLYGLSQRIDELVETNQLAFSIRGSRSYVTAHPRAQEYAYRHLANGELPDAHLWARHGLLESIRGGSLANELESHKTLAQVYRQSGEPLGALEHATLAGASDLVKEAASQVIRWPDFLPEMVGSRAPWVRSAALAAVECLGDSAPPEVAAGLAHELIIQLAAGTAREAITPTLLQALWPVVLQASDDDLYELIPILEGAAPREPGTYLLTDPGVGLLAGRLYRFRPALRQRVGAILGEMAVGGHTNDWSRALDECGEELGELILAFERVSERDGVDLAGPLSELGHLNAATRTLWSRRLRFVDEHPLGERSQYSLLTRYDVPPDFLEEHTTEVADGYIRKLVAIGSNPHEAILNRAAALGSAANVVDLLPVDAKRTLFGAVRPLAEPRIAVSELDAYQAETRHPLSRFQFSFGDVANVRGAALGFLGRTATAAGERSFVVSVAVDWIRSGDEVLQRAAAAVLRLSDLASPDVQIAELASHTSPWVRRAAVDLLRMRADSDPVTLEHLAEDPYPLVRIRVVFALREIQYAAPDSFERLRARMLADPSGIVRAIAAEGLRQNSDHRSAASVGVNDDAGEDCLAAV